MANNKVVTPDFKLHHIRQFVESITEPANTIYYAFAGKPTQYILGDNTIDAPNTNIESLTTRVYDEMVLAKKITQDDVKALAKRHDWTTGTLYTQYDSLDNDLSEKAFFVVSPEGGSYYVFKCLYNNGANSTSQPLFSATSADDVFYQTADGYVWKYMYKLDASTFNKFATENYIPIVPDANVSSNAVSGSIDLISVVTVGKQYNNYLSGSFIASDIKYDGIPYKYRITNPSASTISDFYQGCIMKIVDGDAAGEYRKITAYSISDGYKFVFLDSPFTVDPSTSSYEIAPEVKIQGDGRQTINAVARALINSTASNSVYRIDMLNKGVGYFLASANVYANPAVRVSNSVNDSVLRVIYSPKGGHGYDAESELFATTMGISVKISNNENGEVSTDNDFRTIGLLKDPKFSNVKLNYSSFSGSGFADTEEVMQIKINRLGGSVGVSEDSQNVIGLGTLTSLYINSAGNTTYANTDVITVSNVVINAVCNLVTNSTGYITSISIQSAGYGFSDTQTPVITIANTSEGNVRHVNSKILTSLSRSANGLAYANSDYIEVSGTGVVVNAIATLTTNSIGGITDVVITNSGKGFASNEIAFVQIVNGGLGYSNGAVAFSGGGGTGATATALTDSSGNVQSISFTNRGTAYSSAPTVTPPGTPSLAGTFTAYLQANGISVRIANSIGGYSNGAKVISCAVTNEGQSGLYTNNNILVFVCPSSTHGNAVANVITTANGTLSSVNVNAGNNFGFNIGNTNTAIYVTNSSGGYVRYFNSNIVSSITVSNSAPSYKVSSITMTANGSYYNSTKILRVDVVDGGAGYDSTANNRLIFSGGSGSGANAIFANDSTGRIISVTMVANGTGYTSIPTIVANSQANGIGANLVAVLANSITISSTTNGYGAVAYFTNTSSGNVAAVFIANAGFNYTGTPTATINDPIGTGATFTVTTNGGANNFATNDLVVVYGGQVNASGNITSNATYFATSVSVTNSGRGFSYTNTFVLVSNATSGNIRHVSDKIVKDVAVANGGYAGFASNSDVLYITNGSIIAVGNVTTNATGFLTAVSVTNSGKGFANHSTIDMFVVNSASNGNVRYLNANIASSIAIVDGGTGYNNTDYVVISAPGALTAFANIATTSEGVIESVQLTNKGRNLIPSYIAAIEIVDGGTGYSNADYISFCGGGGTGANALILTNSTGGIVRTYITNGGINYHCSPTVEVANSIGGTANGSSANLVASILTPTNVRIYNSNNNPSQGSFADINVTIRPSAIVTANLIYAPTFGNTSNIVDISTAASLEPSILDSANLYFTSKLAANISLNLTDQRTTFDSTLSAGDYVYIQSLTDAEIHQVNSVTNSTHLVLNDFPGFTSTGVALSAAKITARGNVFDQAAGYIQVTNVTGFFTQSNDVIGMSSKSYANVTGVSYNNISKTGTNVNQLFYYNTLSITGVFQEDEILYSSNVLTGNATARFHSGNSSSIAVVNQDGLFYTGETIQGLSSGASCQISTGSSYKYEGDIIRGSGDIIYIENIEPISRSNTQSEVIKLILEF
jgi:hypothetical protein